MKETFVCIYIKDGIACIDKFEIFDTDSAMKSFHDFAEYKESIRSDMHKEYFFVQKCYQAVIITQSEFNHLHSLHPME